MTFEPFDAVVHHTLRGSVGATILKTGVIELNQTAYRTLGEPAEITVDIDPDAYVLRITAADPDSPRGVPVRGRHRFRGTAILQRLGIHYRSRSTACPGRETGDGAIEVDVSQAPAQRRKAAA